MTKLRVVGLTVVVAALLTVVGGTGAHPGGDRVRLLTPSDVRSEPIRGDAFLLANAREVSGNWDRLSGRLVDEMMGGPSNVREVRVWQGGYHYRGDGPLFEAVVGRVIATSLAAGGVEVYDHRFDPCEVPEGSRAGRTIDLGGVPLFEPRADEFFMFTNEQMINTLVAPAYWIRSELEWLGASVEDLGQQQVAGRDAFGFRVEFGDGISESVWTDDRTGVVLRRVREGVESTASSEGATPKHFRQEWRFEEIRYDTDVEPLTLDDLIIPVDQETVRYRASLPGETELFERRVPVSDGMTVADVVEAAAPSDEGNVPVSSCL